MSARACMCLQTPCRVYAGLDSRVPEQFILSSGRSRGHIPGLLYCPKDIKFDLHRRVFHELHHMPTHLKKQVQGTIFSMELPLA